MHDDPNQVSPMMTFFWLWFIKQEWNCLHTECVHERTFRLSRVLFAALHAHFWRAHKDSIWKKIEGAFTRKLFFACATTALFAVADQQGVSTNKQKNPFRNKVTVMTEPPCRTHKKAYLIFLGKWERFVCTWQESLNILNEFLQSLWYLTLNSHNE